jgi:hypothetical protein
VKFRDFQAEIHRMSGLLMGLFQEVREQRMKMP